MNTEIICPCGDSLIPGSLATEAYIANWKAEHKGHTALEKPAPAPELAELCRREGYASRPYAEGAVIFADEVDALVCARALYKKGVKVTVTGLILQVREL